MMRYRLRLMLVQVRQLPTKTAEDRKHPCAGVCKCVCVCGGWDKRMCEAWNYVSDSFEWMNE